MLLQRQKKKTAPKKKATPKKKHQLSVAPSWDAAAQKQAAAPKKKAGNGAVSAGTGACPRTDKTSQKRKLKKLLADDEKFTFGEIRTTEEPIICHGDKCSKNPVFSSVSNTNPNQCWNLCEHYHIDDFGGRQEKLVPITDKDRPDSNGGNNIQVEQSVVATPPLVDLINIKDCSIIFDLHHF